MKQLAVAAGLGVVLCAGAGRGHAQDGAERPNFLWLVAEDMSPNLGSYGDIYAVTPNLDRLAAEGTRYLQAFAASGVCAPSRSSLILGVEATAAGTQHMRSKVRVPAALAPYSQRLRQAGYYASNNPKEDYNILDRSKETWDESGRAAHWRGRKDPKQPFLAIFNFNQTHESQVRLPDAEQAKRRESLHPHERHDPALAPIPPYHPDDPVVRLDWARYADNVTFMDGKVAEILKQLANDGLGASTIVFFYADHGAGMPRSKRWLYDSSLRVPLVVRLPPRYRHLAPTPPGGVTDRLVSLVDLGPTLLSLAGVPVPPEMTGQAFLGPGAAPPREHVFAFRDRMDEKYDMARAVRDRRWKYIRNYFPQRPWGQPHEYQDQMPTMKIWRRLFDQGALVGAARRFFLPKPPEELYDTWADPHEVSNLAGAPEHGAVLERLGTALDRWMLDRRDTGFLPEAAMHARATGSTPYEMARSAGRYDLDRIMHVATLASRRQPRQARKLADLLRDGDDGVRFWAATGLGALGAAAKPAATALRAALGDASPDVRIAAAEALCGIGQAKAALPVLEAALGDPADPVRLRAANVLDVIGERARPLLPAIKAALEREPQDSYVRRILPRLVATLEGRR